MDGGMDGGFPSLLKLGNAKAGREIKTCFIGIYPCIYEVLFSTMSDVLFRGEMG